MKKLFIVLLVSVFYFAVYVPSCFAQYTWSQKTNFQGVARYLAVGFSIGNKGYVGTGDVNATYSKDFWEYDPATDSWEQKADFKGNPRYGAVGFGLGNKGYIGAGTDGLMPGGNYNLRKDFWEYDPVTNDWTQKADIGGMPRYLATGFSIGSKGYIGLGNNYTSYYNDFWEYDPSTDKWTQKADFGGVPRYTGVGFGIGAKGYIGTGSNNANGLLSDFWEYDQATDKWTQKADFGGIKRFAAAGFSIGSKGYIGTGGNNAGLVYKDFWEYDPATNIWTQKDDAGTQTRLLAVAFSIGTNGFISTGAKDGVKNDLWEYSTNSATANFYSPNTTICSGSCTSFINSSVNATSYQWYFPGAIINESTDSTPPGICYTNAGQYDAELIAINGNSRDTLLLSKYIVVNPVPAAGTVSSTKDTVCSGGNTQLAISTSTGGLQWQSSTDGVSFSTINGAVFSTYETGDLIRTTYFRVKVQSGNCGADSSAPKVITVLPGMGAGTITSFQDTICAGTPAKLFLSGSMGKVQWQSSSNGATFTNIQGATDTSYLSIVSETTSFRAFAGNGTCTDTSEAFTVFVIPAPIAIFTGSVSGRKVTFNSAGTLGATVYSWNFGDNAALNNDVNPTHTFASGKDTFYVCLTVYNRSSCSFTFCSYIPMEATGIASVSGGDQWSIFPDPINNRLSITNGNIENIQSIEIYDVLGRERIGEHPVFQASTTTLDVSQLNKGIYYLKIRTSKADYIQPVIKQ